MDWIKVNDHKDGILVKCIAEIRNNETGVIKEYETNELLENDSTFPNVFNWEENNYSCDCNRSLFFNEEDYSDDVECSDGKFSVNLKNAKNGEIYYKEF